MTSADTEVACSVGTITIVSTSMLVLMARRLDSTSISFIDPIEISDRGTDKALETPLRYVSCSSCVKELRDIDSVTVNDTEVIGVGVVVGTGVVVVVGVGVVVGVAVVV